MKFRCIVSMISGVVLLCLIGVPMIAEAQEDGGEVDALQREVQKLQQRLDQLEEAQTETPTRAEETPAVSANGGDEGFESKDQSGNDPRAFGSKFMPYYRYTKLENDLEVHEMTLFGFLAFNSRFGLTYELPIAKHIDYSGVDAFKQATAGGCPPGSGAGNLPPIGSNSTELPFKDLECDGDVDGIGDLGLRFFLRPQSLEFPFGANKDKNISIIPAVEFTMPTATKDVLGGESFIVSPSVILVFDAPFDRIPFSLGFFAMMNFYDFHAWKDDSRGGTSRYRGRWFWMQPLSKPTPEFSIFDTSGLYVMTELQPVYDFKQDHFSFWVGPEFGKVAKPGLVFYAKPGIAVDPSESKGDRQWTMEVGFRYFFD